VNDGLPPFRCAFCATATDAVTPRTSSAKRATMVMRRKAILLLWN
jgi:hypothetical protein